MKSKDTSFSIPLFSPLFPHQAVGLDGADCSLAEAWMVRKPISRLRWGRGCHDLSDSSDEYSVYHVRGANGFAIVLIHSNFTGKASGTQPLK